LTAGTNQEEFMRSLTLIAAATLVSTTMAVPALARDYCDYHRCYHRGPVGAAADTAAGIAGAAIGTAGAIATAPFRNSYAYDRRDYYNRYSGAAGLACRPGTWFKGEDGRRHLCQ
jgi:hypothetical protein